MPREFAARSVRPTAVALLALAAAVAVAPAKVRAGCTGHVAPHPDADARARLLDPEILGGGERAAAQAARPLPSDRRRPCSGPSCSGRKSPPAVPPVSDARYVEPWACLGPRLPMPDVGSGGLTLAPSGLRPLVDADAIFHPPRLLADRSHA